MNLHWRTWILAASALPVTRLPEGPERIAIGSYIRQHMAPIVDCYDRRLTALPALKGRLVVRFDIEAGGGVARASAEGMSDRGLIDCVTTQVSGWKFEKPAPGVILRVAYPIVFNPAD